jgi:hypothetical protein
MDKSRIIESEKVKVKLLNGTEIELRPITLAERKECLSLLPQEVGKNPEKFAEEYMKIQGDILHYIICRSNKEFKREDVDNLIDSSMIEQIVTFTLKDPFAQIL